MADARVERPFVIAHLSAVVSMSRVWGSLTVVPGYVLFDAQGLVNNVLSIEKPGRVAHTEATVTVVRGMLLPPWLNTGVVLIGNPELEGGSTAVAQCRIGVGSFVAALRLAGFQPELFRTRTSMGGQIGSLPELSHFRTEHRRTDPST